MKSIVRTVGMVLILTGILLFFNQTTNMTSNQAESDNAALLEKISTLEKELSTTKAQLATLQTDSLLPDSEVEETEDVPAEQQDSTASETTENESDSIQSMVLVIQRGMASPTVVNELVKAGIIENQYLFEQYLIESGLNKKIQIGEYKLDSSMDFETIAKIITKS